MADISKSVNKVKQFLNSQINDEANWSANMKLLRALGLFAGSVIVFRSFGEDVFAV